MDKKLEEIQEKFDFLQRDNSRIVMNLFGMMDKRIKLKQPFMYLSDSMSYYATMNSLNFYLSQEDKIPLTEEDMEYLYEYTANLGKS